ILYSVNRPPSHSLSTHCPLALSSPFFIFFFYCSAPHRDLHSFPTRRSSDLAEGAAARPRRHRGADRSRLRRRRTSRRRRRERSRSEEHTSELQSRSDLVCRLLLEKKKK